jgi:uncharacterized protein YdaU (DUF1376 family)
MSRAWMPLYWGDYLRDTRDLSTLQHGAYLLLIGHYWQHGGLPADEHRLAAVAGLPLSTWRRISPAIAAKFRPDWRHRRIDTEIAKVERVLMQRRVAGAKGGNRSALARAVTLGPLMARSRTAGVAECGRAHAQAHAQADAEPDARAGAQANAPANDRANGPAKSQQPATNHNHNQNLPLSSSESSAARASAAPESAEDAATRTKRPHELTRAEIDAIHARRRGTP